MKRMTRVLLIVLGAAFGGLFPLRANDSVRVTEVSHTGGQGSGYRPGELIVQFREGVDERSMERDIRETRAARVRQSITRQRFLVTLGPGLSVSETVSALRALPEVDYAEANGVVRKSQATTFTPNDPRFSIQWNFNKTYGIGAERMWAIQKGSPTVAVAVLDTGIAYEDYTDPVTGQAFRKAPDWGGTVFLPGYDFINNDAHANDDEFHGTHVSSTVAEATNNALGFAGLAFNCALMPVKVLDANGNGSNFTVAEGIDYAANFSQGGSNPVKVINMSLGGSDTSETLSRAVDNAFAKGIVLVAAAGNDNVGTVEYPAAYPNVIAVGALDARKLKASYSNFGAQLSVVAPGGDCNRNDANTLFGADCVWQQGPDPDAAALGDFGVFVSLGVSGTSQATPHVAALAALLVSQGITDPAAVRKAIESTADDLGTPGRDDTYGYGLINPEKALSGLGLNR
jgi:serine protease